MIDKSALSAFIEKELEGTDLFLVDIDITPDNQIRVEIDSDTSVDIDRCVDLTRRIEEEFDRDAEDYDLEVGSSGLTTPFKVKRQYLKNLGNEVEIISSDGRKLKGMLKAADDNGFTIVAEQKVKPEGSKRPVLEQKEISFGYGDVKSVKYLLQF